MRQKWDNDDKSWKNKEHCLDILMLKVGQSQDVSRLKTSQRTELRAHFATKSLSWLLR